MTPDQVEDAGWSSEDWDSFNDLAVKTVERNAQLRRIIPEGPSRPNAYMVELPTATGFSFKVDETRKVSRIKIDFTIEADQLHDGDNIRAQIHRVATALAQWEDRVLAYGKEAESLQKATGIALTLDAGALGLFNGKPATATQADAIERVKEGIETVLLTGYGGILHAAFGFKTYTSLVRDPASTKDRNGIDHSRALLGGDDSAMAWLAPDPKLDSTLVAKKATAPPPTPGALPVGGPAYPANGKVAVFAPNPGSIDLVWTQRPRISHVGVTGGDLTLRLEEAFFLRIKDLTAIGIASS